MFSKTEILSSISANGCTKIGANLWTDGEHNFKISKSGAGYVLKAEPVNGKHIGMREALRPVFIAARRAGLV